MIIYLNNKPLADKTKDMSINQVFVNNNIEYIVYSVEKKDKNFISKCIEREKFSFQGKRQFSFYFENKIIKRSISSKKYKYSDIVIIDNVSYYVSNIINESTILCSITLNLNESIKRDDLLKNLSYEISSDFKYGAKDKQKYKEFINRDFVFDYKSYYERDLSKIVDFKNFFYRLIIYERNGIIQHDIVRGMKNFGKLDRSNMIKVPNVLVNKYNLEKILKGV